MARSTQETSVDARRIYFDATEGGSGLAEDGGGLASPNLAVPKPVPSFTLGQF